MQDDGFGSTLTRPERCAPGSGPTEDLLATTLGLRLLCGYMVSERLIEFSRNLAVNSMGQPGAERDSEAGRMKRPTPRVGNLSRPGVLASEGGSATMPHGFAFMQRLDMFGRKDPVSRYPCAGIRLLRLARLPR